MTDEVIEASQLIPGAEETMLAKEESTSVHTSVRAEGVELSLDDSKEKTDAAGNVETTRDKDQKSISQGQKLKPEDSATTTAKAGDKTTLAEMEQEVGHLSGEYPCVYNHIGGTLYVGSQGFTFKGSIFFYNCHFNVKWGKVTKVFQTNIGHIVILAKDAKEDRYTFAEVHQVDHVWATLVALHSEYANGTPHKEPFLGPMRASLRRMSTEPIPASHDPCTPSGPEAAYVAAATAATMDDLRSLSASRRKLLASPSVVDEPTSDLEEAWALLHESPDESYGENAFVEQKISGSLDSFYNFFLADDAPRSIEKFMQENGDTELTTSPWKNEDDENNGSFSRTIEYCHPINAPLAPPKARARKEQRFRRFGDRGISLETDTYVDDVPMTDCFYVTDRILVRANEDGTSVTLSAFFDIRFVKSTMFRAIISNTTRSESLKWFQAFLNTVRRDAPISEEKNPSGTVVAEPPKAVEVTPPLQTMAPPITNEKNTATTILTGLVVLVLILQMYIMHQMSGMQRTLSMIQIQQADVCVLPSVVKNAVLNAKECAEVVSEMK